MIKPTLITKNKKIKKGKTLKYTAKLLNKNGKKLKNKKITFKINGKKYKAKTNKKGIAKIKEKCLFQYINSASTFSLRFYQSFFKQFLNIGICSLRG